MSDEANSYKQIPRMHSESSFWILHSNAGAAQHAVPELVVIFSKSPHLLKRSYFLQSIINHLSIISERLTTIIIGIKVFFHLFLKHINH